MQILLVKVDTGAKGDILPLWIYRQMCTNPPEKLVKSNTILTDYNKTIILQIGTIHLQCWYNQGSWSEETFFIADRNRLAIIGLQSCWKLKMTTLHCEKWETKPIPDIKSLRETYPNQPIRSTSHTNLPKMPNAHKRKKKIQTR